MSKIIYVIAVSIFNNCIMSVVYRWYLQLYYGLKIDNNFKPFLFY